ncbi:MAG: hypothetical protein ACFFFH_16145 [Candidatus Thorarchaeota archaeon]
MNIEYNTRDSNYERTGNRRKSYDLNGLYLTTDDWPHWNISILYYFSITEIRELRKIDGSRIKTEKKR